MAVIMMAVAAASPALAAPVTPITPATAAHDMENAKGPGEAQSIRMHVVEYASTLNPVEKDRYGSEMVGPRGTPGPFLKLLDSTNNDVALNAAIAIAQVQTLSEDVALEGMLENKNPDVRYWGAKGLSGILPTLKTLGGSSFQRAVEALNRALAKEQSGVVKQQLIKTLGDAGDAAGLVTALEGLEAQLRGPVPGHETLDAAATGLRLLDAVLGKGNALSKDESARAAKAAAWIASFAAQQQVALTTRMKAQGADMPTGFSASVTATVNSAIKVLNTLAGKSLSAPLSATASADEAELAVNAVAGSPSAGPGALQKAIPSVPVPPAVASK